MFFQSSSKIIRTTNVLPLRAEGLKNIHKEHVSGGPDSNRRPPPWQGGILPLNYHRNKAIIADLGINGTFQTEEYGIQYVYERSDCV